MKEDGSEIVLVLCDHPESNRARKLKVLRGSEHLEMDEPPPTAVALIRALAALKDVTPETFRPYRQQAKGSNDGRSTRMGTAVAAAENAAGTFKKFIAKCAKKQHRESLAQAVTDLVKVQSRIVSWTGNTPVRIEGESPALDYRKISVSQAREPVSYQGQFYSVAQASFPGHCLKACRFVESSQQTDFLLCLSQYGDPSLALPDGDWPRIRGKTSPLEFWDQCYVHMLSRRRFNDLQELTGELDGILREFLVESE